MKRTRLARGAEVSPVWFRFAFRHAVLSDSAVVSRTLAVNGSVLLPSRLLKTVGPRFSFVTKLYHFTPKGYGLDVALCTLDGHPHECSPNTRFLVSG